MSNWLEHKLQQFALALRVARHPSLRVERVGPVALEDAHTRIRVDVEGLGVLLCGDLRLFINGEYAATLAVPSGSQPLTVVFRTPVGTLRESVSVDPTDSLARPALHTLAPAWSDDNQAHAGAVLSQLEAQARALPVGALRGLPGEPARALVTRSLVDCPRTERGVHAPRVDTAALLRDFPAHSGQQHRVSLEDIYALKAPAGSG